MPEECTIAADAEVPSAPAGLRSARPFSVTVPSAIIETAGRPLLSKAAACSGRSDTIDTDFVGTICP